MAGEDFQFRGMVVITREIMDAVSFLMGGNGEAAQGVSDDNRSREKPRYVSVTL